MAASTIGSTFGADLVVQQCGAHVLIRGRDEATADAATLIRIPRVTGNALVLASAGAHRRPGLLDVVHECVVALRSQDAPHTVWLAVSGLGAPGGRYVPWLHRLSAESGMTVVAPQGAPIAGRGIGLYAGRAGWRRFNAGDATDLSTRFPMPVWEHRLPRGPLVDRGLVTEPVPAGLAVRPAGLPPLDLRDPRFQTPFHVRVPKLVVGEPGTDIAAGSVAALIGLLPEPVRHDLLVVPVGEQVTTAEWAGHLAAALNHGVTVATGRQIMSASGEVRTVVCDADGAELSEPLATILRHTPDGAPPEVLGVAQPPAGWQLHGRRCYRPQAPSALSGVIAEVLPGGLHVRLDGELGGVTADFDPRRWTMVVGDERRDVTEAEVAALCDLLEGLGPVRCRTVDVHVLGTSWQYALSGFEAYLRSLGVALGRLAEPTRVRLLPTSGGMNPVVPSTLSPNEVTTRLERVQVSPAAAPPHDEAVLPAPEPADIPSVPPVGVFAAPVTTVSGPRPRPEPTPAPERDQAPPAPSAQPEPEPAPSTDAVVVDLPGSRVARARPIEIVDRDSTPAEQTRLSLSAGSAYTEALAAVNVALSAWPMLRADAKADYVAVCLYLGRGEAGAVALGSGAEPFDGYLPCLVSGLRRLPTHRKVVLRQTNGADDGTYADGAILEEPGFLSAAAQLDITTAAADLDLLIWPVSARRTSELLSGRAVDEVVFPAGRQFKALAVRTREPADHAPARALLMRELVTDEDPESEEALSRDAAALPRLERAWEQRQQAELQLVDDQDAVARLTAQMSPKMQAVSHETLEAAS